MPVKTCSNGHPKTPENTYVYRGYGSCRICKRNNRRKWQKSNPKLVKAQTTRWREQNPERAKEHGQDTYKRNRSKVIERSKKWKEDNPEKARDIQLKKYGITAKDYDSRLEEQKNLCAICRDSRGKRNFHVDHDHSTGKVRGLLCGNCNVALGLMRDNPEFLEAAISYLSQD